MAVAGRARRLYNKDVRTAYILAHLEIELAVRKSVGRRLTQFTTKVPADLLCEFPVGIARKYLDLASDAH